MIDNVHFALDGAWQVLLAGLVFGAGLPLVFAVGIRTAAWGTGGAAETSHTRPHPVGWAVSTICLLVVLAGIGLGITIIAATGFGKAVSFEHGYPTIVEKE